MSCGIKKVFIFRHGQTDWNAQGRFQGHIDIPLNDTGREQAKTLIPLLRPAKIEIILSSDLSRAFETANIIAQELSVAVHTDPRLREAHLGEAQGMNLLEIEKAFGREVLTGWRSSDLTDADVSYPGGETGKAVLTRSVTAIIEFVSRTSHAQIGISTHGGVIRRIMHSLLPPESAPVPIPNAVVYELGYNENKGQLFIWEKRNEV